MAFSAPYSQASGLAQKGKAPEPLINFEEWCGPTVESADETENDEEWRIKQSLKEERRRRQELEEQLEYERSQQQGADIPRTQFTPAFFQDLLCTTVEAVVTTMLRTAGMVRPITKFHRMPTPGTGGAPMTFTGVEEKALLTFFPRLERCFEEAGIVSNAERATYLAEYVSDKIVDFVKNLDGYKGRDYQQLKTEMFAAWGNPQTGARYTRDDLTKVVNDQIAQPTQTRKELIQRAIAFETIAQPLIDDGRMTEMDVNKAYFRTLPIELGKKVHESLRIAHGAWDTKNDAFPRVEVKERAAELIMPEWFEAQEVGDPRGITQRTAEAEKVAALADSLQTPVDVGDLVARLSKLNVNDESYARAHTILVQAQPVIANLFPQPTYYQSRLHQSAISANRALVPETTYSAQPAGSYNRGPIPQSEVPSDHCYYCWEQGHRIGACPEYVSHERQGYVKKEQGKIVYKDGSWLRRRGQGGLMEDVLVRLDLEAAERTRKYGAGAHVAQVGSAGAYVLRNEEAKLDVENDVNPFGAGGYAILARDVDDYMWTAADDEDRTDVENWIGIFEGGGMDEESAIRAAVVAVNEKSAQRIRNARENSGPYQGTRGRHEPNAAPKPSAAVPNAGPARQPAFVPVNPAPAPPVVIQPQNPIFRVQPQPPTILQRPNQSNDRMELDTTVKKARQPSAMRFTTEVEENTNVDAVLKKLMSSSVPSTITIGELCGVAPGLRKGLMEMVRAKKVPIETERKVSDAQVAKGAVMRAPLSMRNPSYMMPLPELSVMLGNAKVSALLDTGSMINVIAKDVVEKLGLPVDERSRMSMTGVHGDTQTALGICENISIPFGKVNTRAHFHVFENVPSPLIFGQPWLRDHVISTIENGRTYKLMLRDFNDPNVRVSIVVRSEERVIIEDVGTSATAQAEDGWEQMAATTPLTPEEWEMFLSSESEDDVLSMESKLSAVESSASFPGPLADWA